jgi:hypothetical protein
MGGYGMTALGREADMTCKRRQPAAVVFAKRGAKYGDPATRTSIGF